MLPEAILDLIADQNLRNDPGIKDYNDLGSLVKSHVEGQRMMGTMVNIPGEGSTDEQRNSFFTKLGRPGKAEEYEYDFDESKDERVQLDQEMLLDFGTHAHGLGLSQQQFDGILKYYEGMLDKDVGNLPSDENAEKILKGEWKEKYDSEMSSARKALAFYGKNGFGDWIDKSGFGNMPEVIRFMAEVGKSLKESDVPPTNMGSNAGAEGAKAKIAAIYSDPKHAYNDANHVDHRKAVEEMSTLYNESHGSEVIFTAG